MRLKNNYLTQLGFCVLGLHLITNFASAKALSFWNSSDGQQRPVANCTDFSGSFAGTCDVQGKTITKAFTVAQNGCESFMVDGDEIRIGSVLSETTSAPAAVEAVRYDWDKSQKTLLVHASKLSDKGAALSLMGQMSLDGDKLIAKMKILGAEEKLFGTCALARK